MKPIKHPDVNIINGSRIIPAGTVFFVPEDALESYIKLGCVIIGAVKAPDAVQADVPAPEPVDEVAASVMPKRRGRRHVLRDEV